LSASAPALLSKALEWDHTLTGGAVQSAGETGLTKSQAEDLLDWLENHGYRVSGPKEG
jgi:hypothetical protein